MPPPEIATLPDGTVLRLRLLAEEICRRYRAAYPDEEERYGEAGRAWCVHDNQHILNWAVLSHVRGAGLLRRQVGWLAGVLATRGFPLERLERDLALAADVLEEEHAPAAPVAAALRDVEVAVPPPRRTRRGTAASRPGSSPRRA